MKRIIILAMALVMIACESTEPTALQSCIQEMENNIKPALEAGKIHPETAKNFQKEWTDACVKLHSQRDDGIPRSMPIGNPF